MFTGLIQALGRVQNVEKPLDSSLTTFAIDMAFTDLVPGESVAVDGVCLTATSRTHSTTLHVEASPETMRLTTLQKLRPGDPVHLERAVLPTTHMGGHFVSGHVDGIATLVEKSGTDVQTWILKFPSTLRKHVVKKGSVALSGVSLTVNAVQDDHFTITLIPHTLKHTHFNSAKVGDTFNMESDILAKYVEKLLQV